MGLVSHPFTFQSNLDSTRAFLSEVYRANNMLHYLIPTRIENQKYGPCGPDYTPIDDEVFKIWRLSRKPDSDIVALSHRGWFGNYHIEIHPKYKNLEKELFAKIENFEQTNPDNEKSLIYMYTVDKDSKRITHLTEMGYEDRGLHEYNYEFPADAPIPEYEVPEGFKIRHLFGEEDYPEYIKIVGSVFTHCGEHMTLEKMRFMSEAEFYYDDLHIVATTEDGTFVGFCINRFDPLTKIAQMEGVAVHPDYAGLGLEKAMLCEGLKQMMKKQPLLICSVEIDKADQENELLLSSGYVQSAEMNIWKKSLK